MPDQKRILFTGGSGLLGGEIRKNLPDVFYPTSKEFDVTNFEQMDAYVRDRDIKLVIHAAAFTSPPKIDRQPERAIDVNIVGTSNVTKLCMKYGMKLVYISTDYVFRGDKGNYREEDEVFPVNKYAWSKLGGECAVRLYDNSIIVRTSFGPNVFPYEKAFVDQWTSRQSVADIAKKMLPLLRSNYTGTVHVGGKRGTVYEYAKSLRGERDIKEMSIRDVGFKVPVDTSLSCEKYSLTIEQEGNL